MKVDALIVSAVSKVGGSERVAFQIAKHLKMLGHNVEALIKEPIEQRDVLSWYLKERIRVGTSPHIKPLKAGSLFYSMLMLSRRVKKMAPRSINLHNPGNTILFTDVMAFKLAGVKNIVCSLHHPVDATQLPESWKRSTRWAANMATWVTVTGPALEQSVLGLGVPETKMLMIPLGIEVPDEPVDKNEARAWLRAPKDAFVVGTLARLVRNKRVDEVIRACASSKEFKKRGFLLIGGVGEEKAKLETLAAQMLPTQFRFLGRLDDPARLYAGIDLFALLSEMEGFGLVYVEAGAWGVPSIGCDAGGTSYAIHEGETGFLVPVNKPEEMTARLDLLMKDEVVREHLGKSAQNLALENFSVEKMARSYEQALGIARMK